MSRFKLEFKLKQHTPLIHFQGDQHGATLRATELKPKLDKFLIENVFKGDKTQYEEFLISGQENALDYKVKIEPDVSSCEIIDKKDPLYFGGMGGDNDTYSKIHNDPFAITIFLFNEQLATIIEDNFESFLANTNFGTRQSKGYGSFYIANKSFNDSLIKGKVYSFGSTNWKKDIKLLYAFMRQGINFPRGDKTRFYCKPAIFLYAKKEGWEWDKKAIKAHFFPDELSSQQKKYDNDSPVNYSSNDKYLLRDLFGLSSEQKWREPYRATVKKENDSIDRFKSPITFKYVNGRVYFWANDTVKAMLDQAFKVLSRGNTPLKLKTPKKFDFEIFFEFVKEIDLSKVVTEERFRSEPEYRDLQRMLKNIKASS